MVRIDPPDPTAGVHHPIDIPQCGILIVDDHAPLRETLADVLAHYACTIIQADSGVAALNLLRDPTGPATRPHPARPAAAGDGRLALPGGAPFPELAAIPVILVSGVGGSWT